MSGYARSACAKTNHPLATSANLPSARLLLDNLAHAPQSGNPGFGCTTDGSVQKRGLPFGGRPGGVCYTCRISRNDSGRDDSSIKETVP
jgi:hypothetical protein